MTYYEFYKTMPMERVSILQAARIFPRNTMRNIVIYEQFLEARKRAEQETSKYLRPQMKMDAYMEVADQNALSEDHIRHVVAMMQRTLPEAQKTTG